MESVLWKNPSRLGYGDLWSSTLYFGKCGQLCPRPLSLVARYSAVPRIPLASANWRRGNFDRLATGKSQISTFSADATSGKVDFLVDDDDFVVFVLDFRLLGGRTGAAEAISISRGSSVGSS